MDITKLSINDLKALWLDELIKIENSQKNIQLIQNQLKGKVEVSGE